VQTAIIVDDNREMRETLRNIIMEYVSVVAECEDGNEIVESYRIHHPDWVFMDISMKHVDGVTATKLLTTEFPDAKVVMVSNFEDPEMEQLAETAGSFGYVQKERLQLVRKYFIQDQTKTEGLK